MKEHCSSISLILTPFSNYSIYLHIWARLHEAWAHKPHHTHKPILFTNMQIWIWIFQFTVHLKRNKFIFLYILRNDCGQKWKCGKVSHCLCSNVVLLLFEIVCVQYVMCVIVKEDPNVFDTSRVCVRVYFVRFELLCRRLLLQRLKRVWYMHQLVFVVFVQLAVLLPAIKLLSLYIWPTRIHSTTARDSNILIVFISKSLKPHIERKPLRCMAYFCISTLF